MHAGEDIDHVFTSYADIAKKISIGATEVQPDLVSAPFPTIHFQDMIVILDDVFTRYLAPAKKMKESARTNKIFGYS